MSMSSTSFPSTISPVPAPSSRLDSHEVNPLSGKRVDVAARPLRRVRPLCAECQRRPAVTCVRGRRVVLDDHDMCRQCWRARMDARRPTRRARALEPGTPVREAGDSMCAHDWQPIAGWYARYRCAICRVIGCKLGVVDPRHGRGAEIEPYRCEARRGGERCREPAVYARRGKAFRCASHLHPGRAARARSELADREPDATRITKSCPPVTKSCERVTKS